MAKKTIIVDDVTGAHDARPRRIIIDDGKYQEILEIDLVDQTFGSMRGKFRTALSAYYRVGSVTRTKGADPTPVEPAPEPVRTELPPQGITAKKLSRPKPKPLARPKPKPEAEPKVAETPALPPLDERPLDSKGKPYTDYRMKKTKRPGITAWCRQYGKLLGLEWDGTGRSPKAVEAAFDRYQGGPVTEEGLLPEDLDRLTSPAANGHKPSPLLMPIQKG